MTTAARPTWNPAMGGHTGRDVGFKSRIYHAKELTAHTKLKYRQRGQNSAAELRERNLKSQLQQAEREYTAKKRKLIGDVDEEDPISIDGDGSRASARGPQTLDGPAYDDYPPSHSSRTGPRSPKRARRSGPGDDDDNDPDRDMAISDSDASDSDSNEDVESSDDDDDDDSDDETEQLMRELEKIKRERAEERDRQERERQAKEEAEREEALLTSNPLLQLGGSTAAAARPDFTIKKRWDDDVVFKNQALASDEKPIKRFINDTIRSDFHRKFLSKYIH